MKRMILAAIAATAVLLVPAAQAAGPVSTSIKLEVFTPSDGALYVVGYLTSPDSRCLANRRVAISLLSTDAPPVRIDVARSSDSGGWMGLRSLDAIPDNSYNKLRLAVSKRKVSAGKSKTITCAGKTKDLTLAG